MPCSSIPVLRYPSWQGLVCPEASTAAGNWGCTRGRAKAGLNLGSGAASARAGLLPCSAPRCLFKAFPAQRGVRCVQQREGGCGGFWPLCPLGGEDPAWAAPAPALSAGPDPALLPGPAPCRGRAPFRPVPRLLPHSRMQSPGFSRFHPSPGPPSLPGLGTKGARRTLKDQTQFTL